MKKFNTPELDVEKFQIEDVLTVSGGKDEVPPFDNNNTGEWN